MDSSDETLIAEFAKIREQLASADWRKVRSMLFALERRVKSRLRKLNKALAEPVRAEPVRSETGPAALHAASEGPVMFKFDERDQLLADLQQRTRELQVMNLELEQHAFRDHLTGLFNQRYFRKQLDNELSRARRYDRPLTMIFIDVDNFKHYNDRNGHPAGDEVLRRVGELLQDATRGADIVVQLETEAVAVRYGGEEFVVILPETPLDGGKVLAERLCVLIASSPFPHAEAQPLGCVSASFGVASLRETDNAEKLIERADEALYRAKKNGRNRVELEEPSLGEGADTVPSMQVSTLVAS